MTPQLTINVENKLVSAHVVPIGNIFYLSVNPSICYLRTKNGAVSLVVDDYFSPENVTMDRFKTGTAGQIYIDAGKLEININR